MGDVAGVFRIVDDSISQVHHRFLVSQDEVLKGIDFTPQAPAYGLEIFLFIHNYKRTPLKFGIGRGKNAPASAPRRPPPRPDPMKISPFSNKAPNRKMESPVRMGKIYVAFGGRVKDSAAGLTERGIVIQ